MMRVLIGLTLSAALFSMSIYVLDWRMMLIDFGDMGVYLRPFMNPDFSINFLRRVAMLTAETAAMAVVSSLLAALLAVVLTMLATGRLRWFMKFVFNGLRSVPELLFASFFVIAVGLGPTAGILALTLHTAGVLARLFIESLENAEPAPSDALLLSGAGHWQTFWYAQIPTVQTQWVAYVLYRSEMNIRAATILGLVGAGGLGQQLHMSLSLFQYDRASTLILATLILVMLAEALSRALRAQRFSSAQVD